MYTCACSAADTVPQQELASKLKDELKRPDLCIPVTFVHPDVQCPKKPRGRKKKAPETTTNQDPSSSTKGRPSAAALGFSTEGMTNAEVDAYMANLKAGNKDSKRKSQRSKAVDDAQEPPTKKSTKSRTTKPGSSGDNKRSIETDTCAPKPGKKGKTQQTDKQHVGKRPKQTDKDEPNEDEPVVKPCKRQTRAKKTNAEVEAVEATSSVAETAAHVEEGLVGETPGVADVVAAVEAAHAAAEQVEASSVVAEPDETTPAARELAIAERKAKQSRKSSAYHKARQLALKGGASREEAKAAGQRVTWTF